METLGEEPRPAQLVSLPGDLDAFEVVWQHPRVEFGCAGGAAGDLVGSEAPTSDVSVLQRSKSGAYAELLVALKELVRDAETRAGGAEDTPLADIYQEVAEVGPRSAAELRKAATHYERAAALHPAPLGKADLAVDAARCRSQAESSASR